VAELNPDWLIPQWPAPDSVQAVCTTRSAGASVAPYDGFNLGDHVGDDPLHVALNRSGLSSALGSRPVFMNQVHGSVVLRADSRSPDGQQADACLTDQSGVACTVMVADCLPVLLTTRQGRVVAAAHAGWRGLAGIQGFGVLEQSYKEFGALAQINKASIATNVIAWLGPCIGPDAFEVGDEVRAAFVQSDAQCAVYFKPKFAGKWSADLAGLARWRLQCLGVTQVFGNDSSAAWCTFSNPSKFYSFRRDGVTGRLAACIWLKD
jgi:YfiH family protein